MKVYGFLKATLSGLVRLIYRMKVTGIENDPGKGPLIICANHTSNHDVVVLGAAVKSQLRYFAKASLFKVPVLRSIIKLLGAFPVDKSTVSSSYGAIKKSLELLHDGQVVSIFPQGRRVPGVDPKDATFQTGVGMMVYHASCRVLPVCIQTKDWKVKFFRRTYVKIGKIIEFDEFSFKDGNTAEFKNAASLIFSRIKECVGD